MAKRSFGKATSNKPRKPGSRPQHIKMLIVTEGEVSEPQYFEYVKAAISSYGVNVKCVSGKSDPLKLVRKAVELRDAELASFGVSGGFDEAWVVVDVDTHPTLEAARTLADSSDIEMAISNPCFELWLLLHLQDHASHLLTSQLTELWQRKSGSSDKRVDSRILSGHFERAEKRAKSNRAMHERDGRLHPADNPSTNVDTLVRKLLEQARASSNNMELRL